jgi:hypothetical protein
MTLIAITYGVGTIHHDIRRIEDSLAATQYESIIEISEEDYAVYKGLLVQMEKLQDKLEKLYKQGSKPK